MPAVGRVICHIWLCCSALISSCQGHRGEINCAAFNSFSVTAFIEIYKTYAYNCIDLIHRYAKEFGHLCIFKKPKILCCTVSNTQLQYYWICNIL